MHTNAWMRILVAMVAAAVGWMVVPAAQAKPAPPRFTGVNDAFFESVSPVDAQRMSKARVGATRFTLEWYRVEQSPGNYDWSQADTTVGDLASQGIEATPVLWGTPYWATDPQNPPPPVGYPYGNGTAEPPNGAGDTAVAAWKKFLEAAVGRYGPNGAYWSGPYQQQHPGAAPVPVRVWQVWNEPNLATYFWPTPSPSEYAQLLEISHDAIKAVDPTALVAAAGLPCRVADSCDQFLSDLYAEPGIRNAFDIAAVHPYGPTVKYMMSEIRSFRKVMKKHHDSKKKVWVSEFGWGSAPKDKHLNKGVKGQATLLQKAFTALRKNRTKLKIWRANWFDWRDPDVAQGACDWCAKAGLYDSSDAPKLALKSFHREASRAARARH